MGPNPSILHPIDGYDKLIFLKPFVKASNIFVENLLTLMIAKMVPRNLKNTTYCIIMIFRKISLLLVSFVLLLRKRSLL